MAKAEIDDLIKEIESSLVLRPFIFFDNKMYSITISRQEAKALVNAIPPTAKLLNFTNTIFNTVLKAAIISPT
jgi:hypothetical protein